MIEKNKIKEWWNRNPCCSINSNKSGKEFFDDVERIVYNMHPWMSEYFKNCKDKKVLEVGCGMGRDLVQFARNGANVFGIDLTENSIEFAKKNFEYNKLEGNLMVGDAEKLPFDDNFFDIVYSYGVLHHTIDTQKGIDEIYRVLKNDGKAIVMLYHKWSLIRFTHFNINKYEGRKPEEKEYCPIVKMYSTNEAKKMFNKFSSIKIEKQFVGVRLEKHLPDFIKKKIGWHLIIEGIK